jgi:hypothetical protein
MFCEHCTCILVFWLCFFNCFLIVRLLPSFLMEYNEKWSVVCGKIVAEKTKFRILGMLSLYLLTFPLKKFSWLFRFPRQLENIALWICSRFAADPQFILGQNSRICSPHFDSFLRSDKFRRLPSNAVSKLAIASLEPEDLLCHKFFLH